MDIQNILYCCVAKRNKERDICEVIADYPENSPLSTLAKNVLAKLTKPNFYASNDNRGSLVHDKLTVYYILDDTCLICLTATSFPQRVAFECMTQIGKILPQQQQQQKTIRSIIEEQVKHYSNLENDPVTQMKKQLKTTATAIENIETRVNESTVLLPKDHSDTKPEAACCCLLQ